VSEERIGNMLRSGDNRKRAGGIVGGVTSLARLSAAALLAVSLMLLLAPTAKVAAQSSSSSSTVQLNNAPFTLLGFSSTSGVAIGDVNGDGKPDVVAMGTQVNPTTFATSTVIETFFGNGSGTFPQVPSQTTTLPSSYGTTFGPIALADFNGDGKLDLVTTDSNCNVDIFLGNGSGTFLTSPATFSLQNYCGSQTSQVYVADFNGDGKPDIIVPTSFSNTADLFINTTPAGATTPTFTDTSITLASGFQSVSAVAVADFNGDGLPDLAVGLTKFGSPLTNSVEIILNSGNSTAPFSATPSPSVTFALPSDANTSGLSNLVVGDFNGDGHLDVAAMQLGQNGDNAIFALYGDGNGGLTSCPQSSGATTLQPCSTTQGQTITDLPMGTIGQSQMVAGDFNHDGKADLAFTNGNDGFSVLLSSGTNGFLQPAGNYVAGSRTVIAGLTLLAGDLNGDGLPDVLAVAGNGFSAFLNAGTTSPGTFEGTQAFAAGPSPQNIVSLKNFFGSGETDVAVLYPPVSGGSNATVSVMQTSSATSGTLGPPRFFDISGGDANAQPVALAAGCLTANANPCSNSFLVAATYDSTTSQAELWEVQGGTSTPSAQQLSPTGFVPVGSEVLALATGDFNGDGNTDLALSLSNLSLGNGRISIVTGNGDGTFNFGSATLSTIASAATQLVIAHFQGSGSLPGLAMLHPKVIVPPSPALPYSLVGVLLNNTSTSTVSFQNEATYPVPTGPYSMAAGDFNADGFPDLAVAASQAVTVLLNNGSGSFTQTASSPISVYNATGQIAAGDFGNGNVDLAITSDSFGTNSCNVADTLIVLTGDGTGNFATPTNCNTGATGLTFSAGNTPNSVALGDFNGDGKLDAAVADAGGNMVSLLLNGTAASTAPPPPPQTSFATYSNLGPISFTADVNTSVTQQLSVTNTGGTAFSVSGISLSGTSTAFSVTNVVCNGVTDFPLSSFSPVSLSTGQSCTVTLQFAPTSLASGQSEGLTILDTASNSNVSPNLQSNGQDFFLSGIAIEPFASFSPAQLSFGNTTENSPQTQTVTVTNTGNASLILALVTLNASGSNFFGFSYTQVVCNGAAASFPATLSSNQSCTVTVQFDPTSAGNLTSSLNFFDNAGPGESNLQSAASGSGFLQAVSLSGTGVAPPPPVVSVVDNEAITVTDTPVFPDVADNEPITVNDQVSVGPTGTTAQEPFAFFTETSLNFGNVAAGQTATEELLLQNTGQTPLVIQQAVAAPSLPFTLSAIACNNPPSSATFPVTVAAGGLCTVTVTFQQSATPGTPTGALTFTDNAVNNSNLPSVPSGSLAMQTVPLLTSGSATAPPSTVVLPPDNETITVSDTPVFPDVADSEPITVNDQVSVTVLVPRLILALKSVTLVQGPSYAATFTVSNTGTGTANNVAITASTLVTYVNGSLHSTPASTKLPINLGSIAPGASASVTVAYPITAADPAGSVAVVRISETFSGGSAGGSFKTTLP
jgi:hypothetical protein